MNELLHSGESPKLLRRLSVLPFAAESRVFRRGRRHKPVGKLGIANVVQRLGKKLREVKFVAQRRAVQMILLQPAESFAMRAIGHQAGHVAALRPADQIADAVEQRVGTFKFAGRFGRGIDDNARERFDFRQSAAGVRRNEMNLDDIGSRRRKISATSFPRRPWP